MGGTPGVSQALEAGRIEVGVLGESGALLVFRGKARFLKGASSKEFGFHALDAPLGTTERKIKADRGSVLRFVQAYVEAIHYFKSNRAGTIKILQKYFWVKRLKITYLDAKFKAMFAKAFQIIY